MKSLVAVVTQSLEDRPEKTNIRALARLLAYCSALICVYSVLFHLLMEREGQEHSWLTGFYWTLTVMSTLGFGDITFQTDLGRFYSMVVLVSGVIVMLVLLPFSFIEFFYLPWMRAQERARALARCPPESGAMSCSPAWGPVTSVLIPMLQKYHYPYYLLAPTVSEALQLHNQGIRVVVGDLDDPDVYRRARVTEAAMVVTTRTDVINTNVTFTVRELAPRLPIVASATSESALDVLDLRGSHARVPPRGHHRPGNGAAGRRQRRRRPRHWRNRWSHRRGGGGDQHSAG
ncbi:MAG: potassium channel protein [Rhodobacteraceae bacterium]|nr:potassium channel protein [Paracoccaceae bacterium]